jgi:RHS repeat-associated protein
VERLYPPGNHCARVNRGRFGVRARLDGMVEIYCNSNLLATRDISAWPYYASGGYVGLGLYSGTNTVLDDFGGGHWMQPQSSLAPSSSKVIPAQAVAPISPQARLAGFSLGTFFSNIFSTIYNFFVHLFSRNPAQAQETGVESVQITYTYDPLNRLTATDYDNGTFFHYTYDSTGNRLSEETLQGTNSYIYDTANRLTNVNGATYTWDANGRAAPLERSGVGNLLSDGVNTYIYDHANRLVGVNGSSLAASYLYNGLGNRIQETINGTTTIFVVDQAGELTQVLSDGTNTYLYGNGRIAQASVGDTQYFLGDALSSVRQLVDPTGEVVLSKDYDPFGEGLESQGEANSPFAFAGEWMDNYSNLLYLRARYYSLGDGRFISKDTWQVENHEPMSYNSWLYAYANPVNLTDPSGYCPIGPDGKCIIGWGCYRISDIEGGEECLKRYECSQPPDEIPQPDDPSDPVSLTQYGEKMEEFYNMLKTYKDGSHWWNNGNFSQQDFLAIALYYELDGMAGNHDARNFFLEAATRKFWCLPNEHGSSCTTTAAASSHAVYNYAGSRAVMRSRYRNAKNGVPLSAVMDTQSSYNWGKAGENAHLVLKPENSCWITGGYGYDVPWDWGNGSMIVDSVKRNKLQGLKTGPHGTAHDSVIYLVVDPNPTNSWFVMSADQIGFWEGT